MERKHTSKSISQLILASAAASAGFGGDALKRTLAGALGMRNSSEQQGLRKSKEKKLSLRIKHRNNRLGRSNASKGRSYRKLGRR